MPQNLLDSDSFGGSNGDLLHTYNTNWDAAGDIFGDNQIRQTPGVGCATSGISASKRSGFTWTDDQWCEMLVDGTTLAAQQWLLMLRLQDSGGHIAGYAAGRDVTNFADKYVIARVPPNTYSYAQLAIASAATLALGDKVNFQAVG